MRRPKLKYNEIVEVVWLDTTSCGTWRDENIVREDRPALCHSVGYFTAQSEGAITISPDRNSLKDRSSVVIPWGVIKKIKRLK